MANGYFGRRETETAARALGWFSLALGFAELIAPAGIARLIGARDDETTHTTLRAFGAREIAAGVAILAEPERARWLWSRVAGDGVDLAWLGAQMRDQEASRDRLGAAVAAVAGVTALDILVGARLEAGARPSRAQQARVHVEQVITINRSIDEVYRAWRDFERFPSFMRHLESVTAIDDRRSHWKAKAPAGMSVEWDAEIIRDSEAEWLAWRTLAGSDIEHSGSVRFGVAPGARGTEVRVELDYAPPAGRLGRGVACMSGEEPEQQIREDLRRFKQLLEAGEVALADGPGMWRAAQPATRADEVRDYAGVHE
jgi:uncharacterized membrane protein